MKPTITINDAVRTMGHLLLHRPCTGSFSTDLSGNRVDYMDKTAAKFCFVGAHRMIAHRMGLDNVRMAVFFKAIEASGCNGVVGWDRATDAKRREYAICLTEVTDP